MSKAAVPSLATCLELIQQYGMLDNIRHHSSVVARVADTIVNGLAENKACNGNLPDRALVHAGALLHDIAKTKCLDGSCRHAEEGQLICEQHGYAEVGDIVGSHVILHTFTPENYQRGIFGPREIVYYSDKRVRHHAIVSLDQRLEYVTKRYGGNDKKIIQRIRVNFQKCLDLERYLFAFLPFEPLDLAVFTEQNEFEPILKQ